VTLGRSDNAVPPARTTVAQPPAQPQTAPAGPGSNPLSQGHVAAFVFRKAPEALPEVKFQDAAGSERTMADWRGKVVLVNLWATWCLPCRKEMPSLDRLQKEMGSDKFEVVAISVDRKGAAASKKFLDETQVDLPDVHVDADDLDHEGSSGMMSLSAVQRQWLPNASKHVRPSWSFMVKLHPPCSLSQN
jgi:thiol-disulfide isomerase/thioredoxin